MGIPYLVELYEWVNFETVGEQGIGALLPKQVYMR